MAVPAQAISPEALAEARRLYELSNVPVQNVADMLGISKSTLNARIRRWGWARRAHRIPADIETPEPTHAAPPLPAAPALGRTDAGLSPGGLSQGGTSHAGLPYQTAPRADVAWAPPLSAPAAATSAMDGREGLIGRLVTRIEAEISAVERILARAGSASPGRGAAEAERAARTLSVLVRSLRELTSLARGAAEAEDEPARDPDDFRRDLAATLERVLAGPPRR